MARAGMARWRSRSPGTHESDEVQRSLELLDRVLSEFDDGNMAAAADIPSLAGHQSEDDGYMSMNGRRAKFVLSFRPVPDETPAPPPEPPPSIPQPIDFPPPPEEAERLISTLLPRVSPGTSDSKRGCSLLTALALRDDDSHVTTATQTTLPKTRQQRPHAWQTELRFGSLPYDGALQLCRPRCPPPWLPPRTVPGAIERHREVRRRGSNEDERANFSDDSLEGVPAAVTKRSSIAWEVPMDDKNPLLMPGSTKVVGRRRRRSSASPMHMVPGQEDWPDPPESTEDEAPSPFSDSYYDSSATNEDATCMTSNISQATPNGTYVIRKGRRKERAAVNTALSRIEPFQQQHAPKFGDLKRCSSTFDNIKCLLKEGLIEGLDDPPPDFKPPSPPALLRVISLPTLATDEQAVCVPPAAEEEDRLIQQLQEEHLQQLYGKETAPNALSISAQSITERQLCPKASSQSLRREREPEVNSIDESYRNRVSPSIDDFPPLPPSPVQEDDAEYSEIAPASDNDAHDSLCPTRPRPPETASSLKTRSMDAGFSRGRREHSSGMLAPALTERRTLPSELPGPLRRRTFQKRSAQSPREDVLQASCSLPETPIFARGCDIPRTPHRPAPDVPAVARTTPRPGGLATGGYRRVGAGMGQALVGAELLRLAGGPGRGWYPRHRQQPRPASVERLDRLAPGHRAPTAWEGRDSRKPLTLPPNLSPKFFQRSPREALRRVTSLLIRKGTSSGSGTSSKESKRDVLSPSGSSPGEPSAEGSRQKRGFFRSLWKRSRHYSLEQQRP